jgi:hypothetical protein
LQHARDDRRISNIDAIQNRRIRPRRAVELEEGRFSVGYIETVPINNGSVARLADGQQSGSWRNRRNSAADDPAERVGTNCGKAKGRKGKRVKRQLNSTIHNFSSF